MSKTPGLWNAKFSSCYDAIVCEITITESYLCDFIHSSPESPLMRMSENYRKFSP